MQTVSIEQEVNQFLLDRIQTHGYINQRQIFIAVFTNCLQDLNAIHRLNIWRKSFGNLKQGLASLNIKLYYLDSSVIKLLPKKEIEQVCRDKGWNCQNII